jgi:hypothetical protein
MFCMTARHPIRRAKWAQWDGCVLPGNYHDAAQVAILIPELSHKTKGLKGFTHEKQWQSIIRRNRNTSYLTPN